MSEKVCHISTVHSFNDDRIFFKECSTLSNNGYDTYFIVTHDKAEEINGVKIVPLNINSSRIYRLFLKGLDAYKKAKNVDADIYHLHDPELIFIGHLLKLKGKKVIYDSHEDVPQQILNKDYIGPLFLRKIISKIYNHFEKSICKKFDAVISVTDVIVKKFKCKRTALIRNFPIMELIDKSKPVDIEKNKPVIIYIGGITRIRGIRELINVTDSFKGKIELWILGPWESNELQEECMKMDGWKYTKYFGNKPMDEVYKYLKKADIGCCTLYKTNNHLNSLPVKAYEYMTCSLPVVMSDFPLWRENFADGALFVDPNNVDEIKEKINLILNDNTVKDKLSKNGRKLIEDKFSWEAESKKLINLYNDILNEDKEV